MQKVNFVNLCGLVSLWRKNAFSILLVSLFMVGCTQKREIKGNIKIENKTDSTINCFIGCDFPDTNLGLTEQIGIFIPASRIKSLIKPHQVKEIDSIGLCDKEIWDQAVKNNVLVVLVIGLKHSNDNSMNGLISRYYFNYEQVVSHNGILPIQ